MVRLICCLLGAISALSCAAFGQSPSPDRQDSPVGEWRLHGLEGGETRFSPLDQITKENVSRIGYAWSFDDVVVRGKTRRGMQATPLVVDGTIYFTGPWSVVYAVDARSGALRWRYDPRINGQHARHACCDIVNRGVAYADGKVFIGAFDGRLIALDKESGEEIWRVDTIIDHARSYSITGAPRIAGDLVLIGNGGADFGVRGYVSAYRIDTGALAWRFFTVPSAEEEATPAMRIARPTWSEETDWSYGGGGTVWDSMVYDAELNRVYIGVGNGSPWPHWARSPGGGDNLFLSSIVALDAETGRYVWHYQTTPGDSWDFTATQHIMLMDLVIDGESRKVLVQAPKNGFFYVLDRETGALISAEPYTEVTWAEYIDMKTGRPVASDSAQFRSQPALVKPSIAGGHNWQPMAMSPQTGLVYIPVQENDMQVSWNPQETYQPGAVRMQTEVISPAPRANADPMLGMPRSMAWRGVLKAWDPVAGKAVWTSSDQPWAPGGVLATAGRLVIQGASDGKLRFFDDENGELLAQIETGTAITAPPVTYMVDGKQYIAVAAGFGGGLRYYPPGSAPLVFENTERLLVFTLNGGETPAPPKATPPQIQPLHPQSSFDRKEAARGRDLFLQHCGRCHTYRGKPSIYPNVWNLPPDLYDHLDAIVLEGALVEAGMPAFDDVLESADVAAIREFILRDEAQHRNAPER